MTPGKPTDHQVRRQLPVITRQLKEWAKVMDQGELRQRNLIKWCCEEETLRGGHVCADSWGKTASPVRIWGMRAPVRGSAGAKALGQKGAWRITIERERQGSRAQMVKSQNVGSLCYVAESHGTWHSGESPENFKWLPHLWACVPSAQLATCDPQALPPGDPAAPRTTRRFSGCSEQLLKPGVQLPGFQPLLFSSLAEWFGGELLNLNFSFLTWKMASLST